MSQEFKSLVVKSQENVSGSEGTWTDITDRMPNIIRTMVTGKMDAENAHNVTEALTGMPSVFARAVLFKDALVQSQSSSKNGLYEFYGTLLDEWRGIISAVAMNPDKITRRRVYLEYSYPSKGEGSDLHNVYEPKGAFGAALMDKRGLWVDSSKVEAERKPFIDLLQLDGNLIGANSPESLFFTAVEYDVAPGPPYVSPTTGKFTDPLKGNLNKSQVESLNFFVNQLKNNWHNLEERLKEGLTLPFKKKFSISYLDTALQDFLNDIEAYAQSKSFGEIEKTPLSIDKFDAPFNVIFNHSVTISGGGAGSNGGNTEAGAEGRSTGQSLSYNPEEFLLPEGEIMEIAFGDEANDDPSKLANQPVLFLQASIEGQPGFYSYFALPLSAKGLQHFGNGVSNLISPANDRGQDRLTGVYNSSTGQLGVHLLMNIDGEKISIKRPYKVDSSRRALGESDLLLWPNFISKSWGKYYCYSEIPHNGLDYQAFPFVGEHIDQEFQCAFDNNGNLLSPIIDGRANTHAGAQFDLLISSKHNIQSSYKYEIVESSMPFRGVQFKRKGKDIGVVLIKYSSHVKGDLPYDLTSETESFEEATVGVDFGSTNTSVAYCAKGGNLFGQEDKNEQFMQFKNRRVSLLRNDDSSGLKDNSINPACEDELFFFQNDEIYSNSIKSILTLHDDKRIVRKEEHEIVEKKEIKGGFPCFEKNLPIEAASDRRYHLSLEKIGEAQIIHSMKWSEDVKETHLRGAYLRTLMLHVYAQMFADKHVPIGLKWSYPSSMDNPKKNKFEGQMKELAEVNPLVGTHRRELEVTSVKRDRVISSGDDFWDTGSETEKSNSDSAAGGDFFFDLDTSSSESEGSESTNEIDVKLEMNHKIDLEPISEKLCLTESEAVANWVRNEVAPARGELVLIFDVGGSTTDFSVLAKIDGSDSLLKQSSIQFAARRVSQATSYSPGFKGVLLGVCEKLGIKIQGLNTGESKYSSKTAPFFFEQLVDQLQEEEEFEILYKSIAADCPELMAVNLYVTGLIAFYAGQLTKGLIDVLRQSPKTEGDFSDPRYVKVDIKFAGKGSRIFDWHRKIDPSMSERYLKGLFAEGIGGGSEYVKYLGNPREVQNLQFNWRKLDRDVKYEVSKGLAMPLTNMKVQKSNLLEIIGEDGFKAQSGGVMHDLNSWSTVTPSMYKYIGSSFLHRPEDRSIPYPRFMSFAKIFYQVTSSDFGFPISQEDFVRSLREMRMDAYIKNLPDYLKAESNREGEFQFVQPMIILCGMKFLQDVMLPKIKNNG